MKRASVLQEIRSMRFEGVYERWESESNCLSLVIPGDGGSVDVPADKHHICSPEFFRTDM